MEIKQGTTRIVLVIAPYYVLKIPQLKEWRLFLHGLLANLQEHKFGTIQWAGLCPVTGAVPLGFGLIMRYARPLTDEEWKAFNYNFFVDKYHMSSVENKRESFGVLNNEIVAVDYGT